MSRYPMKHVILLTLLASLTPTALFAQATGSTANLPFAIAGPPPPVPPAVVSRDEAGRTTVRAVRIAAPLQIDGQLNEPVYAEVLAISDFVQAEPREGSPALQKTEVWLLYDDRNVYVVVRCWEANMDRLIANEMRRDASLVFEGTDNIAIILDTFYDRRNSVFLAVNAASGRADGQTTNERGYNGDWNIVWQAKSGRFDGGWTVEVAVPFKSLRYRPGRAQVWGFNIHRKTPHLNERSYLSPVPVARGVAGIISASLAATAVGIEAPATTRNLEVKPYATASVGTSRAVASSSLVNDLKGDAGLDVKYAVTQGLSADLTYNTDFAQVEADEQQVNLTRFSLFFPEKREFFLENQGTFNFGMAGTAASDTPILFYSRRIGLNNGREIPIQAGGRFTGQIGPVTLGVLGIRTGEEGTTRTPATTFSSVRVRRNVLRKSSLGAMYTGRSVAQRGVGRNDAFGVDANIAFFDNLQINTYWARTRTDGLGGEDASYRGQLDYAADRYGVQLEYLFIGEAFNPEVGFLRRPDMRKSHGQFRFSPRPRNAKVVRKYSAVATLSHIENAAGHLETQKADGEFSIEYQSGDKLLVGYAASYEFLPAAFRIAPGVILPSAGYDFGSARVGLTLGQRRRFAGNILAEYGTFYSGHMTAVGLSRGRTGIISQVSVEPTISINRVDLPQGAFTTTLAGSRVTYTVTPQMFASALIQYNSGSNSLAANVRLRWEYQPGSELFVVFNEQRDTLMRGVPDLLGRALIVKITRLLRP